MKPKRLREFGDAVETRVTTELREVVMTGALDRSQYHGLAMRLTYLASVSKKPVTITMNSHGGYVTDGLAMYDLIMKTRRQCRVNIVATGVCMSMAVVLMQAATHRYATPNTRFMIHELSLGGEGRLSDLREQQDEARKLQQVLYGLMSKRTGLSVKELAKLCERRDYYLSADEAHGYNLIDRIVA